MEPWEISEWGNYPYKKGRTIVGTIALVLVVNAIIDLLIARTLFAFIFTVVMFFIASFVSQGMKGTRIIILLTALFAPFMSIVWAASRATSQWLTGGDGMLSPLFLIKPAIMLLFSVYVIYALFINKNVKDYLNAQAERRKPR